MYIYIYICMYNNKAVSLVPTYSKFKPLTLVPLLYDQTEVIGNIIIKLLPDDQHMNDDIPDDFGTKMNTCDMTHTQMNGYVYLFRCFFGGVKPARILIPVRS